MKLSRRDTLFKLPLAATMATVLGQNTTVAAAAPVDDERREDDSPEADTRVAVTLEVVDRGGQGVDGAIVRRGVPFPKGALRNADRLVLRDTAGASIPLQTRTLATWDDRSIRWLLVDWPAVVAAGQTTRYVLTGDAGRPARPDRSLRIVEDADAITVVTGPLRVRISKRRFSLIEEAAIGETGRDGRFRAERVVLAPDPRRDALVTIEESFADVEGRRYDYGLGGDCLASLGAYTARVEEQGPLSAVIRCDARYRLASPMGIYHEYEPLHLTVRLYCAAGQASIRVLHTFTVAHAVDQARIREIAVRIPHGLGVGVAFVGMDGGAPIEIAGATPDARAARLVQRDPRHWRLVRGRGPAVRRTDSHAEDGAGAPARDAGTPASRPAGWVAALDDSRRAGLIVALPHRREATPNALAVADGEIRVSLWHPATDDERDRLSFARYSPILNRAEYEGIASDGLGVARTSELHLGFWRAAVDAPPPAAYADALLHPPHARLDPAWCDRCEVTGGLAPANTAAHPREERMMAELLAWMMRHVAHHGWYGLFDYGDLQAGYDLAKDQWRRRGGWGWNNNEWEFRHGIWIQYLRTGDPTLFEWGEVCTRHSVDVDTCHYHPLRPYFVGGSYRHGVQHWSDEPSASHTFIENWIDYYQLTGDARTRDVIEEAGAFFLRFAWTHHPRISFSLRSIANVFRGLVHVYELTWDRRYLRAAERLLDDVILPGQNRDGAWYKRFVVCRADHLPEYLPFGLATEGQTTAIEMGTMPPFTEQELARFARPASKPENTAEELVGYQSHYLMVGLEQYYRLTKREDVKRAFLAQLDWFCDKDDRGWETQDGRLAPRHVRKAIAQQYYGILTRECGFGYRLTGDARYLEVGRALVEHLLARQDRSDRPLHRGSVLTLHPLVIGTLFWGVPYFLKVERVDAGV